MKMILRNIDDIGKLSFNKEAKVFPRFKLQNQYFEALLLFFLPKLLSNSIFLENEYWISLELEGQLGFITCNKIEKY